MKINEARVPNWSIKHCLLFFVICCFAGLAPTIVHAQTAVTSIVLSGPLTIPCNSTVTYSYTVKGTFTPNSNGDPNSPDHYVATAWDNDGPLFGDDKLDQRPAFLFPSDVTLLPGNLWEYSDTFTLQCLMPKCVVIGKDGSSHETTAEVFVSIRSFDDPFFLELKRSNELSVTCTPEPGALALLTGVGGVGGVCLLRRRKLLRR